MDPIEAGQTDAVASTAGAAKPKRPLPDHCFACDAPVRGPYCYACGQKNDDCRRSILRLGTESLGDFVAFDGRAIRTLRSIVTRPGAHVRRYGDGKRSPYSPPVRFFLIVSLIFFTTLALTNRHMVSLRPEFAINQAGENTGVNINPSFFTDANTKPFTEAEKEYIRTSLNFDEIDWEENSLTINGRKYSASALFDRGMSVLENPGAFNGNLNQWIPRLMIVLIPMMALLGALFIRGKDALIYDHLLVALNTHAVMFLILTFAVLGSSFATFIPRSLYGILLLGGIPLYYILTLKGAFRRGWIKTLLSSIVVLFIYSIMMLSGLIAVTTKSMIDVL